MLITWLLGIFLFTRLWWILTNGARDSSQSALPAVLLVTLLSVEWLPHLSRSLPGTVRFIFYFLRHAIRGGLNVVRRVMYPRLPIFPVRFDYLSRLLPGLR